MKAAASVDSSASREREEVGNPGAGRLQLPEAGLTDEEVHAIAAMLRGNTTIVELNLRGNLITDEGARAIAAVLNGRTALRTIDLRGNKIGRPGLRAMAEALERSERVRHVYVHAGGKIEALGTGGGGGAPRSHADDLGGDVTGGAGPMVTVETICVVDIRENNPPEDVLGNRIEVADKVGPPTVNVSSASPFNVNNLPGVQKDKKDVDGGGSKKGDGVGGGNTMKHGSKSRKKSEERLNRQERERKKQAKILQDRIDRENRLKEQAWDGRAGGLEVRRLGSEGGVGRRGRKSKIDTLPPLDGEVMRSSSAEGGRGAPLSSKTAPGNAASAMNTLQQNPLAKSLGNR